MGTYEKMARAMAEEAIAKGWDTATCRVELEYAGLTCTLEEILFWELLGF